MYGAKEIYKDHGEVLCSCSILEGNYAPFTFTSKGMDVSLNDDYNYLYDNINITKNG